MPQTDQPGYFVFSMDTELSIGFFDKDKTRAELFSGGSQVERQKMTRLLDLFDEFEIACTWAIVGHMFYDHCEKCDICPILEWRGKYKSFDEAYGTDNPLWYGADVIEMILARGSRHEIAYHGYTHEVFNEKSMSHEKAAVEIDEWMRVAQRKNITPTSIVFPRDDAGHLDLFASKGFTSYRSGEEIHRLMEIRPLGPLIKTLDHILSITTPPIFRLSDFPVGAMVKLRPTQHIFGFNRTVELALDKMNLHTQRIERIVRAIHRAAAEGKVAHIWAHPWEFRTEKDMEKLSYILSSVSEEVLRGRMRSVGMTDLAQIVKAHQ